MVAEAKAGVGKGVLGHSVQEVPWQVVWSLSWCGLGGSDMLYTRGALVSVWSQSGVGLECSRVLCVHADVQLMRPLDL